MNKIIYLVIILAVVKLIAKDNYSLTVTGNLDKKSYAISIDEIKKKKIKEKNPETPNQLLKNISGVSLTGNTYYEGFSIRGLGRKRILILVDGEKLEHDRNTGAGFEFLNIDNIKKIEVIKGPFSSEYGSGGMGGVINVTTKDAVKKNDLYFNGNLSSGYRFPSNSLNESLSIRTGIKKVHFYINGNFKKAGNYFDADGIELQNSDYQTYGVDTSLKYLFSNKHFLKISYKFSDANAGQTTGDSYKLARFNKDMHNFMNLKYSYDFKNSFFKRLNLSSGYHNMNINAEIRAINIEKNKWVEMEKVLSSNNFNFKISQKLKLSNNYLMFLGITSFIREGVDIANKKTVFELEGSALSNYKKGIFQLRSMNNLNNTYMRSIGFFLQNDLKLLECLNINYGIRFDIFSTGGDNYIGSSDTNLVKHKLKSNKDSSFSGNIGLVWNIDKNIDFKFNVGNAFRVASIKERYLTATTPGGLNIANPNLKPEKSINTDINLSFKNKKIDTKLSLYFNKLDDLITLKWNSDHTEGKWSNIGKAYLYGFEYDLALKLPKKHHFKIAISKTFGGDVTELGKFSNLFGDKLTPLMDTPPLNITLSVKKYYKIFKRKNWMILSTRFNAGKSKDELAMGDHITKSFYLVNFYLGGYLYKKDLLYNISVTNLLNKLYSEHYNYIGVNQKGREFSLRLNYKF